MTKLILDFAHVTMANLPEVGGKNASLGEMITHLSTLGIRVPPGFALTTEAYRLFLQHNQLEKKISRSLKDLDPEKITSLKKASEEIKNSFLQGELPKEVLTALKKAYDALPLQSNQSVAIRSSATAEDLPSASFAGQLETLLNVNGWDEVCKSIPHVYASLFTERAIAYRTHHGFDHLQVGVSVGIQQMIRSDLATSGVMFTLDTESGYQQVMFITASYGLGEAIVQGEVNPDEFYLHKPTLLQNKASIVSRTCGDKALKMVYRKEGPPFVHTIPVPEEERNQFCLSDEELLTLAHQGLLIEKHYGRPMDIEWAKDGIDGQLYILQARPETVKNLQDHHTLETFVLLERTKPLLEGRSVGQRIGQGPVRILNHPQDMSSLQPGDILVADMTDPDWEPVMKKAAGIVTNRGGRTCHAAIIARELGIPAVVGCKDATSRLHTGQEVTLSCAEGETGFVYEGLLPFEIKKTKINELPSLPVKIYMNLANPKQAFSYQFLPNQGVGLARLEFIISDMIGVHPRAVLDLDHLPSSLQKSIYEKTAAYSSPVEFYIEKLAEGIATIAAAFFPRPIIVRFSDFKSNEYAHLLGGEEFEPHEENPMIGYRGASRYLLGHFIECFALECEAIRRVRYDKGLVNTQVMVPFVRTLEEAEQLILALKKNGIERHVDGLQIYMMCEIPSNALLANEFLKYFDGFSIGSNDLTQLCLGLDRDSSLVSHLFDERNPAVKELLQRAIQACKAQGKYIGICGQGPSDHADFAAWLLQQGIDTISLTPDSIIKTWLALGELQDK